MHFGNCLHVYCLNSHIISATFGSNWILRRILRWNPSQSFMCTFMLVCTSQRALCSALWPRNRPNYCIVINVIKNMLLLIFWFNYLTYIMVFQFNLDTCSSYSHLTSVQFSPKKNGALLYWFVNSRSNALQLCVDQAP